MFVNETSYTVPWLKFWLLRSAWHGSWGKTFSKYFYNNIMLKKKIIENKNAIPTYSEFILNLIMINRIVLSVIFKLKIDFLRGKKWWIVDMQSIQSIGWPRRMKSLRINSYLFLISMVKLEVKCSKLVPTYNTTDYIQFNIIWIYVIIEYI